MYSHNIISFITDFYLYPTSTFLGSPRTRDQLLLASLYTVQSKYALEQISYDDLQFRIKYRSISKELKRPESIIRQTIPETVALRKQDGGAFLEKTELLELVEWRSCVEISWERANRCQLMIHL